MIRTVLVANRGEIARRVFRACRLLGLGTVAVYSDADRESPHVRDADRAVAIGPPPARASYLDAERILAAARESGADAIHPGYGFLSENWAFAEACRRAGIVFIGPSPEAIRRMGDKTEARRLMAAAGVPVVPGSPETLADVATAERVARDIGYPVLLKAAAGGGGIGMARVDEPAGTVLHLHERECSIQRRHQKLVEESPAPNLPPAVKEGLTRAAVAGARAIEYVNAGTLEFLVDAAGGFYFLEMNTRLQVEHPVTEEATGLDLVVEQLRVAAGEPLAWRQEAIVQRRAAIECRVYAEDPAKNFLPSPGTLTRLELPAGEAIRIESGVEAGSAVPVHYDPLLFKLVVSGRTRGEAVARLADALERCVVEGVKTTIPLLRRVVAHAEFVAGRVHTQMVEQGAFND